MESIIRRLKIQIAKANLEFNRVVSLSLEKEFNRGECTTEERIVIVRRWDAVAREGQSLQRILESLQQQEALGHGDPDVSRLFS